MTFVHAWCSVNNLTLDSMFTSTSHVLYKVDIIKEMMPTTIHCFYPVSSRVKMQELRGYFTSYFRQNALSKNPLGFALSLHIDMHMKPAEVWAYWSKAVQDSRLI